MHCRFLAIFTSGCNYIAVHHFFIGLVLNCPSTGRRCGCSFSDGGGLQSKLLLVSERTFENMTKAHVIMDEDKNVARKPVARTKRDGSEKPLQESHEVSLPKARAKRRRRSDTSSDEESEEENSDIAPDVGMKPEPSKHVQQSMQDRLNETWKKFANAVDCDNELRRQLETEEKLTKSLRRKLTEEKNRQKQLTKLIENTKANKK